MNRSVAHLVTLWCAMLHKTEKGIIRCLGDGFPFLHFRVLAQLNTAHDRTMSAGELTHALFCRPTDVRAAVLALVDLGWLECVSESCEEEDDPSDLIRLTQQGAQNVRPAHNRVLAFLRCGWDCLSADERALLMDMSREAIMIPGSYYARRPIVSEQGVDLPVHCYVTAIAMLTNTINTTAKKDADLSFTDFRLLLELYPKRRGVDKRLRAREIVRFLSVGRAYVSIASARLEDRGLLERIPDENDARGVLYRLTNEGRLLVEDVCEDLYAVYAGLFGLWDGEDARMRSILRKLLESTEEAVRL